ncbi:hypothetical protein Glove_5g24 [Diversispora epigaea]|uniref:BTB domain-containing protein n=1 Tax=Diversispora epigaea TaxID=1348612 RepID=A0A397JZ88_9GLOM|nr:hypothetical protein Glove_5g24 [Diversispora epigaea]
MIAYSYLEKPLCCPIDIYGLFIFKFIVVSELYRTFNDNDDYNLIIEIKNEEKSFTAHSNILKYLSSYFRRELENIHPNKNNIKTIFNLENVAANEFELDELTNKLETNLIEKNIDNNNRESFIFNLENVAANEFELDELTNKLETNLIEKNIDNNNRESFVSINETISLKMLKYGYALGKLPVRIFENSTSPEN